MKTEEEKPKDDEKTDKVLLEASKRAARTGELKDLQEYLKLRRERL